MDEHKYIIDQMNYEIFLAEEGMKFSLNQLKRQQMFSESTNLEVLNEASLEIIKKYIKKVSDSVQKAWDSFKEKIDYKTMTFILENNKKYLESDFQMKLPDDFEYPEIEKWSKINDGCKLGDNKLDAGNYATMKPYLEDPDKFLDQYYKEFVEQTGDGKIVNISETFNKRCFSKADANHVMTSTVIGQYVNFLKDYKAQVEEIQNDINTINEVNNNIDNLVRQILGESTLLEAEEDQSQTQKPENTNKFRSATGEDKPKTNVDRQNIINWYKAMTQILSAKMRTCNKVKSNALRIVTNFVRLQGGLVKLPDNLKKEEGGQ